MTLALERPRITAEPVEPIYACERVDGRPAVFRLDTHMARIRAAAATGGMPVPGESSIVHEVRRALRDWRHTIGEGAAGVHLTPVLDDDFRVDTAVAGGQLRDQFTPRTLQIIDSAPYLIDPARWNGHAGVFGEDLAVPAGVRVFFRYADRLVAPPADFHSPTATSSAVRTLAADNGLPSVPEPMPVDRLVADCAAGLIRECFVTTVPPVILPVGSVTFGGQHQPVGLGHVGRTAIALWRKLSAIRTGRTQDRHRWMYPIPDIRRNDDCHQ